MSKKMSVTDKLNLLIERDSGNEVLILMQGKHVKENWKMLKAMCDRALQEITNKEFDDSIG